jgi:hypothetical protein
MAFVCCDLAATPRSCGGSRVAQSGLQFDRAQAAHLGACSARFPTVLFVRDARFTRVYAGIRGRTRAVIVGPNDVAVLGA